MCPGSMTGQQPNGVSSRGVLEESTEVSIKG